MLECDVIALARNDGFKKLSAVDFLEKYKITEFLKKPSKEVLPDQFVEHKQNYLTLTDPTKTQTVANNSTYLIFLTEPEVSDNALQHSKKYYWVEKNPSTDEVQALKNAIKRKEAYSRI